MMMKKILIFLTLLILMSSLTLGLAPCNEAAAVVDSGTFTNVDVLVDETLTIIGSDEKFNVIINITPITTFNFTNGHNETFVLTSALNNTNSSLYWTGYDSGSVIVKNGSNDILGSANYTAYGDAGVIYWNLVDAAGWNESINVYVYYNKSFTAGVTDLVALGLGYDEGTTGSFGVDKTWGLLDARDELNNTDWTVTYSTITRACAARDSCQATKLTIFAGFGLIAVAMIVLSGFLLIRFGGVDDMMSTAMGIIGLAVIIMVGYVITSQVANSICQAAVG